MNGQNIRMMADAAAGGSAPVAVAKEEAPKKIKVRALLDTPVDGKMLSKDQEGLVTEQQYAALAARLQKLGVIAMLGLLCLMGGVVKAQQYIPLCLTTVTNNNSNNTNTFSLDGSSTTNQSVPSSTTLTYKKIIPVTKYGDVAIVVSGALQTAGATSNIVVALSWSVDATNWESIASLVKAGNGTTTIVFGTNITVNSYGYVRFDSIANTNTIAFTNILVEVVSKPRRLGALTPVVRPGLAEQKLQSSNSKLQASLKPQTSSQAEALEEPRFAEMRLTSQGEPMLFVNGTWRRPLAYPPERRPLPPRDRQRFGC